MNHETQGAGARLQYYIHEESSSVRFELAGALVGDSVRELEQRWSSASSAAESTALIVDLTYLTAVDEAALQLLNRWQQGGARLVANSAPSRRLIEPIAHPCPAPKSPVRAGRHWWFRSRVTAPPLAVALMLISITTAQGAELRPETVNAWEEYIGTANSRLIQCSHSQSQFLWVDEAPDRSRRVRRGEIVVSPVGVPNPKSVPNGLIHNWIGASFVPNAKLQDVLALVRDYSRYKDIYRPNVIDSQPLVQSADADKFSMVVRNKALFSKSALDGEYDSSYTRLDDRRWYNVAYSTRVQQIDNYGQPGERKLPPDEGNGYIWRLYSISRFEERDGGVYIELEVIALSRDIPASLRWLVDPIVRSVSRGSLSTSLQQTRDAVRTTVETASRSSVETQPNTTSSHSSSAPASSSYREVAPHN